MVRVVVCTPPWSASSTGRCYTVTRPARSVRECIDLCSTAAADVALVAAPVCITSEAEQEFIRSSVVTEPRAHWIGRYQMVSTWDTCVSGENTTFSARDSINYMASADTERLCARLWPDGSWKPSLCDPHGFFIAPCVCASDRGPTDEAIAWLDRSSAADYAKRSSHAARAYTIASLLAVLPLVIIYLSCFTGCLRKLQPRRQSAQTRVVEADAIAITSATLEDAQTSAANVRARVSFFLSSVAWVGIVFPAMNWINSRVGVDIQPVGGSKAAWMSVFATSVICLVLSIFPTDIKVIRAFSIVYVTLFSIFFIMYVIFMILAAMDGQVQAVALDCLSVLNFLCCILYVAPTLDSCGQQGWRVPPRLALRRQFVALRVTLVVNVARYFIQMLFTLNVNPTCMADEPDACAGITALLVLFTLTVAFSGPYFRGSIHRWLGQLGSKGSDEQEAAAVAALLGGGSVEQALKLGQELFRSLPLSALTQEDLELNTDSGLYEKTTQAKLGEPDAFVSHSWSDPGTLKFQALSAWGARFVEEKRDGTIWLDKACIRQTNISQDLQILPVFLSGCRTLLVLPGNTYCSRLWCVMELFIFTKTGGSHERIEVHALGGEDVRRSLQRFDAAKAKCFLPADRHRLLAVIEAGFGNFGPFNLLVRSLFSGESLDAKGEKKMSKRVARGKTQKLHSRKKAEPLPVEDQERL